MDFILFFCVFLFPFFLCRLFVRGTDIFADKRLPHHLQDSLGLGVPIQNASRIFIVFLGLVADRPHLDVVEVEELLVGQLRTSVSSTTRGTSERNSDC